MVEIFLHPRWDEKDLKETEIRDKKRMEVLASELSKEIYQSSAILFDNFVEQTKNLIIFIIIITIWL